MKGNIDLIKAMRTFIVVVEQQSFSAASQQLNLVTSAVSRQVSDLEKHYDCQLLYRTTRSMNLTAEGEFYLEQFRDLLTRLDSLESITHARQHRITGRLRITMPMNAYQLGLQEQFAQFTAQFPGVKLSLLLLNRFVNLVEEGIDLAIRVGELEDSTLVARRFGRLDIMFVASPDYLAANGTPAHPKQLRDHDCLIDSSTDQPRRWRYQEDGRPRQVSVDGRIDVNSGGLIATFAAGGHGIAQLPGFLAQPYLDTGELVPILQAFQLPSIPVSLVYPGNRSTNAALKALVQHLLDNRLDFDPA